MAEKFPAECCGKMVTRKNDGSPRAHTCVPTAENVAPMEPQAVTHAQYVDACKVLAAPDAPDDVLSAAKQVCDAWERENPSQALGPLTKQVLGQIAGVPRDGDAAAEPAPPVDAFRDPVATVPSAVADAQKMGPVFAARFPGMCEDCTEEFQEGDQIRADGQGGYICADCTPDDTPTAPGGTGTAMTMREMRDRLGHAPHVHDFQYMDDGKGHSGSFCTCGAAEPTPAARNLERQPMAASAPVADVFTDPAMPAEPESVNGQPEPSRDGYGRYACKDPRTGQFQLTRGGKVVGFTRATTFAKTVADTFNLSQWSQRMVVKGLTIRPDLLAEAHGLDVSADKDKLNRIAEEAKNAAGAKAGSTYGTLLHKWTEILDGGLLTGDRIQEIPPRIVDELRVYAAKMNESGLSSRPEWIERTTMVTEAFGEPVAGTLDRIEYEQSSGEHLIADVKSAKSMDSGQGEIAIQLLTYAVGVNENGLYNWNTHEWEKLPFRVSEERAIVMHVPVTRKPGEPPYCTLYEVDLTFVHKAAKLCADARKWNKVKGLFQPYTPRTAPNWDARFSGVRTMEDASQAYTQAASAGLDPMELQRLVQLAQSALRAAGVMG